MNEDSRGNSVVGSALKGIGAVSTIVGAGYGIDKAMMSKTATNIMKDRESPLRGVVGKYRMNKHQLQRDIDNYKKEKEIAKNVSNTSKDTSNNVTKVSDTIKNKKYTYSDETYNRAQELIGAKKEASKSFKQQKYMQEEVKGRMKNNPDYIDAFENIKKNVETDSKKVAKLRSKNVARNAGNVTVKRAKSGALSKAAKVINKIK